MRFLISGGLGLVGANFAAHRLAMGDKVVVLDNYLRGQSNRANQVWLEQQEGADGHLKVISGSVANQHDVEKAIRTFGGVDAVLHAAAQSSVNLSIKDPETDFMYNAAGTFWVLESLRRRCPKAKFIFTASNKVYDVTGWPVERLRSRYQWTSRRVGPSESLPFATDAVEPYGASKIAGFYYTRCYAAMYDMPAVVTVPSGMYGPRQFGKEEQGWLGHFVASVAFDRPITFYGDGHQVRDMVHVDDVCVAFDILFDKAAELKGHVFNIGGGVRNAISLKESISYIEAGLGKRARIEYDDWRPMDNKVYISNIEKMVNLGWTPSITIQEGIEKMCRWVESSREEWEAIYSNG